MNLFCKMLLFIMKITVAIFFSNSKKVGAVNEKVYSTGRRNLSGFVLLDKRSHIRHQPIIIFLADLNYILFTAVALLRQF